MEKPNQLNAETRTPVLCTFGNPLLDFVVKCDDKSLLVKYRLKPDDAIEVEKWQLPLFEEVLKYEGVKLVPGGSALNTSRVFQYLFERASAVTFFGCIGQDRNGEILKEKVLEDGLDACYTYDDNEPTGVTAALVFGAFRSLCANIGAANCFKLPHLLDADVQTRLEASELLYVEGYFLTHSHDCAMYLGKLAKQSNKLFAINLSAVYVCKAFGNWLLELMPYTDVIFGNAEEFIQFAQITGIKKNALGVIAVEICNLFSDADGTFKKGDCFQEIFGQGKTIVATQGSGPVVVSQKCTVQEFPVPSIPEEQIADTVGAGDAFVGGFLSQLVQLGSLQHCVRTGIEAAATVVKHSGCTFRPP